MLTVTDMFCGAGGSSTGAIQVPGVQIKIAANHWDLAVETHNTNHPTTDHACVDLHLEDPHYFPRTDILWASPECTKWSQANGSALPAIEEGLFKDPLSSDAATRSRLLMFDVLKFIELHRYQAVIVENVVDIATQPKYALAWQVWRQDLTNLGYQFRVVSLNSMHAQHLGDPAPQSRDRIYIVAWPKGNRAPDIDAVMRPKAWCPRCDQVVESVQAFKPGRTIGKYRQQYVYLCSHPGCGTQVEPGWLPASAAIDWSLLGTRIGDRATLGMPALAEKTRARIAAGIARYWSPIHLEAAGHTYDAADPKHRRHGDPNGYYRAWPVDEPLKTLHTIESKALAVPVEGRDGKTARPVTDPLRTATTRNETGLAFLAELRGGGSDARTASDPLSTVTASGNHHGLCVPAGGTWNDDARPTTETHRTMLTRDAYGLVTPYYGRSTPKTTQDPLPTVTTVDRHALVMRNNTARGDQGQMSTPASEVMRTLTTTGHQSLLTPGDLEAAAAQVDDVLFRMLTPREVIAAMAFPTEYIVLGNQREQVRMAGNAVTPPAARDLIAAVADSLTDTS